jgi:hypothetical protein
VLVSTHARPNALFRSQLNFWRWLAEGAPSERAFFEAFQAQVDVCLTHDTVDRLSEIAVPTLVLSGEYDVILPPRFGQAVAAGIPGARFEVIEEEAHQPFQEVPDDFNARVDTFLVGNRATVGFAVDSGFSTSGSLGHMILVAAATRVAMQAPERDRPTRSAATSPA